ncbi:hypothetical protein D0U04_15850 [Bacillus clarus]|uniref:Uncharacterized protein n=1 Tax=Bacillus clarus TaxID=2338372 RepID=A0A090YXR3_9BACI|nr:hypothetical protein [Bacillus clarus]KFN03759.1 hypothetical protein DJ93_3721 [Bacillus clarus]RFT66027.1 hypothetical protein D0U04_15850 [Bacillus clarus]
MCSNFLSSLPEEPKAAVPLEQEFTIGATIYGARAWSSNNGTTVSQDIWKSTLFASASQAGQAVYPLGIIKIVNLSYDTVTVTTSQGLNTEIIVTIPPQSETVLTSSSLSDVSASSSGTASRVNFFFHIFFSRDPVPALLPIKQL